MYFRYTISACILFCFLFIAVVGCDLSGKSKSEKTLEQVYEQSVTTCYAMQEEIEKGMIKYRELSSKVSALEQDLKRLLAGRSAVEALELFQKHKDIPSDLRPAYSKWREIVPFDAAIGFIGKNIEQIRDTGGLDNLFEAIRGYEIAKDMEDVFNETTLNQLRDELNEAVERAQSASDKFSITGSVKETDVYKSQKERWKNW